MPRFSGHFFQLLIIKVSEKESTNTLCHRNKLLCPADVKKITLLAQGYNLLRTSMPNSNFLVFSESFYIKRFKNKGYRYYLGRGDKQPPLTVTSESKQARKKRYIKLMNKNSLTKPKPARHLGFNPGWVIKVLNY